MDEQVALRQQQSLRYYLRTELAQEVPNARATAREKLTKLQKVPFHELSTDVYDESVRRQDLETAAASNDGASAVPFLQVRSDFHPKRNQARQKLATLPVSRFKDLASDVLYELSRRFPAKTSADARENASQQRLQSNANMPDEGSSARPSLVSQNSGGAPERPERNANHLAARRLRRDSSSEAYTSSSRGEDNFVDASSRPIAQGATTDIIVPTKGVVNMNQFDNTDIAPSLRAESSAANSMNIRSNELDAGRDLSTSRNYSSFDKGRDEQQLEIASLHNRIESLEAEIDRLNKAADSQLKEHSSTHERLRRNLDEEKSNHADARDELDNVRQQLESLQLSKERLRDEHESVKRQLTGHQQSSGNFESLNARHKDLQKDYQVQKDLANSLRGQLENVIDEMQKLASRNENLLHEQNRLTAEMAALQSAHDQMQAKMTDSQGKSDITSQITQGPEFTQRGVTNGGLSRVHLQSFRIAIDDLIVNARSDNHSNILKSMRKVLSCSKTIGGDVQAWMEQARHLDEEERENIEDLQDKLNATMDNLATAARNHAAGMGLSPTSLLDAAASHVAATIVELVKVIGVRADGMETTSANAHSGVTTTNGHSNAVERTPFGELRNGPDVPSSKASPRHSIDLASNYERSSLQTHASPNPGAGGYQLPNSFTDSTAVSEDWEDLKNHLEGQTEQVVSSIQAVLTCVRSAGNGGAEMSASSESMITEHITQIITIISSVIAVTRQSFAASQRDGKSPSATVGLCTEYLQGLETSCEQMSEIHTRLGQQGKSGPLSNGEGGAAFPKASKQALASASFSIAKTLKQLLNALGGEGQM